MMILPSTRGNRIFVGSLVRSTGRGHTNEKILPHHVSAFMYNL